MENAIDQMKKIVAVGVIMPFLVVSLAGESATGAGPSVAQNPVMQSGSQQQEVTPEKMEKYEMAWREQLQSCSNMSELSCLQWQLDIGVKQGWLTKDRAASLHLELIPFSMKILKGLLRQDFFQIRNELNLYRSYLYERSDELKLDDETLQSLRQNYDQLVSERVTCEFQRSLANNDTMMADSICRSVPFVGLPEQLVERFNAELMAKRAKDAEDNFRKLLLIPNIDPYRLKAELDQIMTQDMPEETLKEMQELFGDFLNKTVERSLNEIKVYGAQSDAVNLENWASWMGANPEIIEKIKKVRVQFGRDIVVRQQEDTLQYIRMNGDRLTIDMIVQDAKRHGLSDAELEAWKTRCNEGFREFYQRKMWELLGNRSLEYGSPQQQGLGRILLEKARISGVHAAVLNIWKTHLYRIGLKWYQRTFDSYIRRNEVYKMPQLIESAVAFGVKPAQVEEMRRRELELKNIQVQSGSDSVAGELEDMLQVIRMNGDNITPDMFLNKAKTFDLSEAELEEWKIRCEEGFRECFQRRMWELLGSQNLEYGSLLQQKAGRSLLEKARMCGIHEAVLNVWKTQLYQVGLKGYLRTFDRLIRQKDEAKIPQLIEEAVAFGVKEPLVEEMRRQELALRRDRLKGAFALAFRSRMYQKAKDALDQIIALNVCSEEELNEMRSDLQVLWNDLQRNSSQN